MTRVRRVKRVTNYNLKAGRNCSTETRSDSSILATSKGTGVQIMDFDENEDLSEELYKRRKRKSIEGYNFESSPMKSDRHEELEKLKIARNEKILTLQKVKAAQISESIKSASENQIEDQFGNEDDEAKEFWIDTIRELEPDCTKRYDENLSQESCKSTKTEPWWKENEPFIQYVARRLDVLETETDHEIQVKKVVKIVNQSMNAFGIHSQRRILKILK